MRRSLRFSDLSAERQTLVRLCQALNYGEIQTLSVRNSEPVFAPPPVILVDEKLDSDPAPRCEVEIRDFVLPEEVCRLLTRLDELRNLIVVRIEVRAGIPFRLVF